MVRQQKKLCMLGEGIEQRQTFITNDDFLMAEEELLMNFWGI